MEGKTPTAKDLRRYVEECDVRVQALRTYKNVHGLQGQSIKYHYLFDFVHGGGENHPTVLQRIASNPVIDNKIRVE